MEQATVTVWLQPDRMDEASVEVSSGRHPEPYTSVHLGPGLTLRSEPQSTPEQVAAALERWAQRIRIEAEQQREAQSDG